MITWKNRRMSGRFADDGERIVSIDDGDIYCDSTDEKPTKFVANGAFLLEIDTGKCYFFSESLAQWFEFGGGGD